VSLELIEKEIYRFVSTSEPEVTCISGHWGVGKTFAWNQYLRAAHDKNDIALKRYSYVSLFGINSLEELKYAIFENSVASSEIGVEPSLETLQTNTSAALKRLGRKSLAFLQQAPALTKYVGNLGPLWWFLSVNKWVVCIDDIERRGSHLSLRDVLGLVSTLKELKHCKVVLILNDEALEGEREQFDKYFEKVIDTFLKFAPTASESVRIAVDHSTKANKPLGDDCVLLGISNIRVIKKIERIVHRIEPTLKTYDEQVVKEIIHSVVLLAWTVYEPNLAPTLECLRRRGGFSRKSDNPVDQKEAAWNALLDVFGFSEFDEFDLALLKGIQDGFFDLKVIAEHAELLNTKINLKKSAASFSSAWNMFHDSFLDNQEETLDVIHQSFINNVQHIEPWNLDGTVRLFKELGRGNQALEMIGYYVANKQGDRGFFDLDNSSFPTRISDPEVIEAFKNKYKSFGYELDPHKILKSMIGANGWTAEDLEALSKVSVETYYKIFKENQGQELRGLINTCLQFDRMVNASRVMTEIWKESAINALRVKKYGVQVDTGDATT
jgi:hypothetical protein